MTVSAPNFIPMVFLGDPLGMRVTVTKLLTKSITKMKYIPKNLSPIKVEYRDMTCQPIVRPRGGTRAVGAAPEEITTAQAHPWQGTAPHSRSIRLVSGQARLCLMCRGGFLV